MTKKDFRGVVENNIIDNHPILKTWIQLLAKLAGGAGDNGPRREFGGNASQTKKKYNRHTS